MTKKELVTKAAFTNHFTDVNSSQNSDIQAMVETALKYKITTSANTEFRPTSNVSRAEAYAMLMSSVCMKTHTKDADWQKNIWASAKTFGLTTRELANFEATKPILTQELMTIAVRTADWAEKTGGCNPRPNACLQDFLKTLKPAVIDTIAPIPTPPITSVVESSDKAPQNIQEPGTFVYSHDTDTHTVYSYIVKTGGTPAGVRNQYSLFVDKSVISSNIAVRDISGKQYAERIFILAGQIVFVYVKKEDTVVTPEASQNLVIEVVPAGDESGVFIFDSETNTITTYRYIVKFGGNV